MQRSDLLLVRDNHGTEFTILEILTNVVIQLFVVAKIDQWHIKEVVRITRVKVLCHIRRGFA